ncbi:spore germination protein, partial [Planococcus sp. SIMBA_160]
SLHLPHLADVNTKEELFADIYSGKLLIYFEGYNYLVSTNIANRPQRTPEETTTEVTIKGPRDNFIEDLSINVALIRKRMRTNSLSVKYFEVGR